MDKKYVPIPDAARELGLSPRQVHRRLAALRRCLDGHLDGHLRRGPHGAWLLDRELLDLLRRVEDYRQSTGGVLEEAVAYVASTLRNDPSPVVYRQSASRPPVDCQEPIDNLPADCQQFDGNVTVDHLVEELKGVRAEIRWLTALILVQGVLMGLLVWLLLRGQ